MEEDQAAIEPVLPAGERARAWIESVGAPLLTMQRTAYDDSGHAVEYGRHAYRPDLYSFDMTLVDR